MKRFIYLSLFLTITGITYTGCIKEKIFPAEPSLEFKEFVKYDSVQGGVLTLAAADCILKFKDGDGDLGGDDAKAIVMKYLYKNTDGNYVYYDANGANPGFDTLMAYYKIPDVTPQGQYKALEGEIKVKMTAPIAAPFHSFFKYEITIRDRAGNISNVATTDEIANP